MVFRGWLKAGAVLLGLLLALVVSLSISLLLGSSGLGFPQLVAALKSQGEKSLEVIFFQIRLPRILLAAEVGIALALAGTSFQAVLRNPLADPYIIGTSAGAALGAAGAYFFNIPLNLWGFSSLPLFAFLGAMLAMTLVYQLSRVGDKIPVETFLLAGVVVGSLLWALVSFLLTVQQGDIKQIIFWLMGTFQGANWSYVTALFIYLIICSLLLLRFAVPLNLLSVGEETALYSGVEVEKLKIATILTASLATAAAVCVSGIIGFVGLMVPHIARRLLGADNRIIFPAAALLGALLLIWSDNCARLFFSPQEIPVGIVTALIGAPFFLWLLRQRKRNF